MTSKRTPVFIGSAWPYANGPLHIGHIAALLPADILARFFRLKGRDVLFVSGSDCHGTPISVRAEKDQVTPKQVATIYHEQFEKNFNQLGFSYSLYGSTMDPGHAVVVQKIFSTLYEKGFIYASEDDAFYCEKDKRFLPDRYIEGTCPVCKFDKARGDQCDSCGSLLDPKDLISPKCKICSSTPITKKTEHFYFALSKFEKKISQYIKKLPDVRGNISKHIKAYMSKGLHDRAITRDLDWGIPVPIKGYEQKRIYVWFEAVCGYLTASQQWSQQAKKDWEPFWGKEAQSWYVYGKDNIPFHTILWPAICLAYDERLHLADYQISSEYLQLEGKKISTSRNWAIWIPDMLKLFSQTQIRYGLLAMAPETSDANFSLKDFQDKFNNEFIATLANYIQRVIHLAVRSDTTTVNEEELTVQHKEEIDEAFDSISKKIESGLFRSALQEILHMASLGNKQLDNDAPWKSLKTDPALAQASIRRHCRYASQFGILIEPFFPEAAFQLQDLFSIPKEHTWDCYTNSFALKPLEKVIFSPITDESLNDLSKLLG